MLRHILFDWSGTLVDDLDLTLSATNYVFNIYKSNPYTKEEFRAHFRLPYPEFYEEKLPGVSLDELENHYRHAFDQSDEKVFVLPYAREFLDFCRSKGISCSILSSMDSKAFDCQVDAFGLRDYFSFIWTGVRNKQEKIYEILEEMALDPSEAAFIGDMTHDVETAKHAKLKAIAVLTGYQNEAQLNAVNPDLIVANLAELKSHIEAEGFDF